MNHIRQLLNLATAASLFPAATFWLWSGLGRPVGEISRAEGFSPETPAGYAFGIWTLIFTLTLVYAVRQALPGQRANPLYRRIGWATAGSSALNSTWMVLAQLWGNGWWLVTVIIGIWTCALVALVRVEDRAQDRDRFDDLVVRPMAGLLAAWLSAAVWLNLSSYLKLLVPDRFGLTATAFALATLACIAVASWLVLARVRGNAWVAGTTVWAAVAVAAANLARPEGDAVIAGAAVLVAAATVAIAWTTGRSQSRHRAVEA